MNKRKTRIEGCEERIHERKINKKNDDIHYFIKLKLKSDDVIR